MNEDLPPAAPAGHEVGKRWESGGKTAGMGCEAGAGLPGAAPDVTGPVILPTPAPGREREPGGEGRGPQPPTPARTSAFPEALQALEAELQSLQVELRDPLGPDHAGIPAPPLSAGRKSKNGKKPKKKGKSKR